MRAGCSSHCCGCSRSTPDRDREPLDGGSRAAWPRLRVPLRLVDTFTFQGPEFYPKLGYREYARLDYPPDHHRIFFRKNLDINILKDAIHNWDARESSS